MKHHKIIFWANNLDKIYLIIKNKIEKFMSYTSDVYIVKVKAKADGQIERHMHAEPMPTLSYIPSEKCIKVHLKPGTSGLCL
jgi:hypothetical protein